MSEMQISRKLIYEIYNNIMRGYNIDTWEFRKVHNVKFSGFMSKALLITSCCFVYDTNTVTVRDDKNKKITTYINGKDIDKIVLPLDCESLFRGVDNIKIIDISNLDKSRIINGNNMFRGCTRLKKINFCDLDIEYLKTARNMFRECYGIEDTEFLNKDTFNSLIDITGIYSDCTSLEKADLNKFKGTMLNDISFMFDGCINLRILDLGNLRPKALMKAEYAFTNCKVLEYLDIKNLRISNDRYNYDLDGLFDTECELKILKINKELKSRDICSNIRAGCIELY